MNHILKHILFLALAYSVSTHCIAQPQAISLDKALGIARAKYTRIRTGQIAYCTTERIDKGRPSITTCTNIYIGRGV